MTPAILLLSIGQLVQGSRTFHQFCVSHPAFEAEFTYQLGSKQAGYGKFVRDSKNGLAIEYLLQGGKNHYIFRYKNESSLEVWDPQKIWDRLPAKHGPIPMARFTGGDVPYPIPLAVGNIISSSAGLKHQKAVKVSGGTEYSSQVSTRDGLQILYFEIGNDGRLMTYGQKTLAGATIMGFKFYDYKFAIPARSAFSLAPPLHSNPYAFSLSPNPITTNDPLPSIFARNNRKIAQKINSGTWMIVMTDRFLPSGFASGLAGLPKSIYLLGLSIKGHENLLRNSLPKGTPIFALTEADFDQLGVAMTPQFYLMKNGKLKQAWIGYDYSKKAQWIGEVTNALQKPMNDLKKPIQQVGKLRTH